MLIHIAWAAAAACAFAAGYWTSSNTGETGNATAGSAHFSSTAGAASNPDGAGTLEPRFAASLASATPLTPEQARERGFHLAADPMSRVARMRQVCALLPQVTAENWREVLGGFEAATKGKVVSTTGDNFNLLLEHVGAVAGAEALKDALSPEKVEDRGRFITILKGWADADAKGCVAWYEAQPPEIQKRYMGHFVAGVARTDPKTALEFTFRPENAFLGSGTAVAVVNNAIATLGVQGVEDVFLSMRGRPELTAKAKHEYFANLMSKRLPTLGQSDDRAGEVLRWFGNHVGQEYVGATESTRIVGEAARANPAATVAWLETQGDRLTPAQAGAGYSIAATEMQKRAPNEVEKWLAGHAGHPQQDTVATAATNALIESADLPGALKMARAVRGEAARNKLQAKVQALIDDSGSR